MVVLAGGQRLLLMVVRLGLSVQGGTTRGSVITRQDVNLSVVIHLQLPVLRVVAQLLSKYGVLQIVLLRQELIKSPPLIQSREVS